MNYFVIKKELGSLQEQQIMVPLGIVQTARFCDRIFIVPKPNEMYTVP